MLGLWSRAQLCYMCGTLFILPDALTWWCDYKSGDEAVMEMMNVLVMVQSEGYLQWLCLCSRQSLSLTHTHRSTEWLWFSNRRTERGVCGCRMIQKSVIISSLTCYYLHLAVDYLRTVLPTCETCCYKHTHTMWCYESDVSRGRLK